MVDTPAKAESDPGVPVWGRPCFEPGGGDAEVTIFLFSQAPNDGAALPLRSLAHGVPATGLAPGVDVRTVSRAEAPDWVNGFFSESLMELASSQLGWDGRPPVEPTLVHVVRVTADDPQDLAHLQSAWALARAFTDTGAFALLDAHAHKWLSTADLARRPPDGPLSFPDEVSVLFETEPSSEWGHIVHTRGMKKFGRPDLVVTAVPPVHGARIGAILNRLGARLAEGAVVEPGDTVEIEGVGLLEAEEHRPMENAPQLNLNNRGLVLRPLVRAPTDPPRD